MAANHAGAVDADGRKTRDALVWLSRRGLTDLGTGTAEIGGLAKQGAVISTLDSVCVSSAFSLWAHRMAIEYIKRFGSSDLRSGVLPSLLSAAVSGSTAMAGGFLDELGPSAPQCVARPQRQPAGVERERSVGLESVRHRVCGNRPRR